MLSRIGSTIGWLLTIVALALWLAEAVHRGHLAGVLIVAVALAAVVVVPVLNARLRKPE